MVRELKFPINNYSTKFYRQRQQTLYEKFVEAWCRYNRTGKSKEECQKLANDEWKADKGKG